MKLESIQNDVHRLKMPKGKGDPPVESQGSEWTTLDFYTPDGGQVQLGPILASDLGNGLCLKSYMCNQLGLPKQSLSKIPAKSDLIMML